VTSKEKDWYAEAHRNIVRKRRAAFDEEVRNEAARLERAEQAAREGAAIFAGSRLYRENERAAELAEIERGRMAREREI
jgi:hypothetical protein